MFAIRTCSWLVGLCTNFAVSGSKIVLRLLVFRKFTPSITGNDKFSKTTAEPSNKKLMCGMDITTSTCPTAFIDELAKAPLAFGKFDGPNLLLSPPHPLKKEILRNGDSGGHERSGIDKEFTIDKKWFTSILE